jgi:hypothetical protein
LELPSPSDELLELLDTHLAVIYEVEAGLGAETGRLLRAENLEVPGYGEGTRPIRLVVAARFTETRMAPECLGWGDLGIPRRVVPVVRGYAPPKAHKLRRLGLVSHVPGVLHRKGDP